MELEGSGGGGAGGVSRVRERENLRGHTRARVHPSRPRANFFSRSDFDEWQRGTPQDLPRGAPGLEGFPEELADELGMRRKVQALRTVPLIDRFADIE